jgi:hypothetical protein
MIMEVFTSGNIRKNAGQKENSLSYKKIKLTHSSRSNMMIKEI